MSNGEDKKILLLVDDEPSNIQVVNSILKDTYKIRIATNGAKALELVKVAPPPDLILLDVMMPGMDGYEVCNRLKSDAETKEIPVIFLTGKTESEDETRGFDVGAVDYIHKPFSPAVVRARVQTHLALRGTRQQLANQLLAIQKELALAREIQLSIVPKQIPRIQGLDIAARYSPMTSVAGDFYDFIPVDDKHLGVFIADVSGHGVPAALVASMLKIALASQTPNASDPAKVLAGLNQALCGKFQGHYVTAAYMFVDLEKNSIRYAGAAHPAMLLGNGSPGGTREVIENGLFIGMFPHATYSSIEVPVAPGDRAVLCTDGIPETTNAAEEQFEQERIQQFMETSAAPSSDQFCDDFLAELSRWSGRPPEAEQEDDITLVVVRWDGSAQ
ncbi:MAG: SpoIIE family protein phosphatase [Bryobacteraceae bacterium]